MILDCLLSMAMHLCHAGLNQGLKVKATFYSHRFEGRIMADGERFVSAKYTAAYNRVPLGTLLEVTYKDRKIIVRVTDRKGGNGRGIDLSREAFKTLGMKVSQGIGMVTIRLVTVRLVEEVK